MIKIGTLCYVVTSCVASPRTRCAVGKIVEVVSLPYEAPDWTYLPGTYYDVRFERSVFYCRSDKLRPISDPDADVTEQDTRRTATPVAMPTESRACTAASPDIESQAGTSTARAGSVLPTCSRRGKRERGASTPVSPASAAVLTRRVRAAT